MTAWLPYCGSGPAPEDWLTRWNLDPWLLAVLLASAVLATSHSQPERRALSLGAVATLAVAFASPLCALSSALFAARTVHHVLIVGVAAPLIAYALPSRAGMLPATATGVQALVFWSWHAPGAYASALSHDLVYWLMQASILASAVWFWMALRRASTPVAIAALLAAMIAMGLLGAVLTFAPAPLYAPHLLTTQAWGLTPLEDQQTAGLIMWAPAAAIYLVGALLVLGRWIGPERPSPRAA